MKTKMKRPFWKKPRKLRLKEHLEEGRLQKEADPRVACHLRTLEQEPQLPLVRKEAWEGAEEPSSWLSLREGPLQKEKLLCGTVA